jgi:gliding motility-associated-like protein
MIDQESGHWIDRSLAMNLDPKPESSAVTLPVVFHIIQDGNQGNLNDADITALLGHLNDAFANRGFYNPNTGADTEISFCLVKQDENGLPTTGITRTNSSLTNMTAESEDDDLKALVHWDATCYINIYIVFEINSAALGPGVQGYANFPSAHGSATDGIVIETAFANGSPVNAAVLIHEMGHFLGLYHTFQGGCANNDCINQGDRICDTPPDNSTAPSDCANPINSCNTDAQSGLPSDVPDMVTNYMDYGYLNCRNDFTQGQADRMMLAINTQRISFLTCESCQDPCPDPIAVTIGFDSLNAAINRDFRLWASAPPNGATFEWLANGTPASSSDTFNTAFPSEGKQEIILKTTGADPRCVSFDTVCIEVTCPVALTHSLKDTTCLEPGSTLTFSAQASGNTGPVEWYLEGILEQTGNTFNWTVPAMGVFKLVALARNADCTVETREYIIFVSCGEVCDNEIDDDGDGLIDGFDPDCCDSLSFYFDPCYESCPIETKDAFSSIRRKYSTSGFDWHEAGSPLVGDIDNDGEVEVVGLQTEIINGQQEVSRNYLVVNGRDGSLEINFQPAGQWRSFSQQLAIADTDRDGYGELYSFGRSLTRHDVNPNGTISLRWSRGGGAFAQPTITDVDEDGLAEIVVENGIFDAATGQPLIGINTAINGGNIDWVASKTGSAVVDVLPDDFCPNCDGKELVLGGEVYSVNINRAGFSSIRREVQLPGAPDGYTSIADMDMDGDLDAVVIYTTELPDFMSQRHLLVWDIQTPTMLLPEFTWITGFQMVSQCALGDVNGDDIPEIVTADYQRLRCMSISGGTWQVLFNVPNDDRSGMAGSSLFDFDSDGKMEVLHRDQSTIRILDENGNVLFSDFCDSGTGWETPVVADIDGDREAELLCSCQGSLQVYEAAPGAWPYTRPVWNQNIYYTVNINDDLTIPVQEQAQHLPGRGEFNVYLGQYGTRELNGSDIIPALIDRSCDGDRVKYQIEICNQGPAPFTDTLRVTSYNGDPRTSPASIFSRLDTLLPRIDRDSCLLLEVAMPRNTSTIYLVINDDGSLNRPYDLADDFPSTEAFECDFTNNILELSGYPDLPPPDLGPDTVMCDFGTFVVDAGPGYASYRWPDFSSDQSYTVWQPGTHWVEVTDSCGEIYTDTIVVRVDPTSVIDLGKDTTVCFGDSLIFNVNAFDNIQWSPAEVVDCPTCPTVIARIDTALVLSVTGETQAGCFSFDSIRIGIGEGLLEVDSIQICAYDSILINGLYYKPGAMLDDTIGGTGDCDSIRRTLVYSEDLALDLGGDVTICEGDTLRFDLSSYDSVAWDPDLGLTCPDCPIQELIVDRSTLVSVTVYDMNMCMVTDEIAVTAATRGFRSDTAYICLGDSIFFNGSWIKDTGKYDQLFSSPPCDSIYELVVLEDNSLPYSLPDTVIKSTPTLTLSVTGDDSQIVEYLWRTNLNLSCTSCPGPSLMEDREGEVILELILANGCRKILRTFIVILEDIPNVFIPNTFSPNGDNLNDLFTIFSNDDGAVVENLRIFDRWGELVYQVGPVEVKDLVGWDGRFNGEVMDPGVFVIALEGTFSKGQTIQLTSSFTLLY